MGLIAILYNVHNVLRNEAKFVTRGAEGKTTLLSL